MHTFVNVILYKSAGIRGLDDLVRMRSRFDLWGIGLVNVEPVMMMVAVSTGLYITSSPLFTYWARCIAIATTSGEYDVKNATAICAQLTDGEKDLQDAVEKDIASTKVFLQMANTIPTLVMAPLIGTWSDKRGRRNPLLYTLIGFSLYSICQLMATLTYRHMNIYYWYFAGEILIGLTGGLGSFFGTSLAIVTDDCRNKLKPGSSTVPMRIGVASFMQSIGSILGTLGMSMLAVPSQSSGSLHQLSYIKSTTMQLSFAIIALVYTFLMVRETHFPLSDVYLYNRLDGASADSNIEQPKSFLSKMRGYMLALVEVLTMKRPGWTRCCLIMSLFFVMIEFLALVCSIIMSFCPMLSSLIFNPIFNATLDWWPGFTFFVGGILQLFVVAGQGGIHCLMRPQWLIEKRLKNQMNTHSLTVGDDNAGEVEQSSSSSAAVCSDLNITSESPIEERRNVHI
ncbi:hypothetical protein TELCIR_12059 [Teladorsagia circumcincta]|uniref:Transporter, major facilitator family protein n=1 Tax=Teladorsagia circumcincta TaxID=45464 RepID=A0A2G9U7R6_TELCI|nr:hypothetical protein TELCIR_12059 [Teladorsagia circumcincta]